MKLTIREVLEATGGSLMGMMESPEQVVTGVSTDSRTLRKGDLFVALRGETHDGHDHIEEVFQKGAVGAIIDKPLSGGRNLIQVHDTLKALGDLARDWRSRFSIPVVVVTGSNGKTTTKEMIAAVLGTRYRVLKTEGNFNNLIGLPLTIFRLDETQEAAVLEMGMNRPGEIDRLAEIAQPVIGVITNVARAHLEGLGNLSAVADAKGELLKRLPADGIAVLNADDASFPRLKKKVRSGLVTFGKSAGATVKVSSVKMNQLKGLSFSVRLGKKPAFFKMPVLGRHNISNALAAIAVGDQLGISAAQMKKALGAFQGGSKRMEILSLPKGIRVINDCYNANPDSTLAALQFLKEAASAGMRRVAILGEMLELGASTSRCHREIGVGAAKSAKLLFAVGPHAKETAAAARRAGLSAVFSFSSVEEALPSILSSVKPKDLVLIKGSRGMKMERVTEALKGFINVL
jgi:UDP-N-acetylmuramoyl-tripeptide--D-alanyl-D-alanine ligase